MIRVRSVKVDGTVYGNMVLLCHFEDGMKVFGETKHIMTFKGSFIHYVTIKTEYLERHYPAFKVLSIPSKVVVHHPHELAITH